jgi:hypothetical protein
MAFPDPTIEPLPVVQRSAPYWLGRDQQWAHDQLVTSHLESLYSYGEYSFFVLMWTANDLENGLVGRCQRCYLSNRRASEAFGQGNQARCPECFGSTFEGGYRARIIRPAMWTDSAPETAETPRGQVTSDTMAVETTADFTMHRGDYIFRADGHRYRAAQLAGAWVRTGLAHASIYQSIAGMIPQVRLEDEEASVAYDIPPDALTVQMVLARRPDQHLAGTPGGYEDIRGPLQVAL